MAPPPSRRRHLSAHRTLPFLLLLLSISSAQSFNPADNYLLNCGSSSSATFADGSDNRIFRPDNPSSYSSLSLSFDAPVAVSNPNLSLDLYRTARVFQRRSSYSFLLNQTGPHVVRLHFYPFSDQRFNLSAATFSVSASGTSLLSSFTPRPTSTSNPLILKEFFLNININTLTLSFDGASSFAFVSAIEVISLPPDLIQDSGPTHLIRPAGTAPNYSGLSSKVLETIHRVNIGGQLVTPSIDTLWRTWVTEGTFLDSRSPGVNISAVNKVKYQQSGGASKEVAPRFVYGTCRAMYRTITSSNVASFNLTWALPVTTGRRYLVRLHFCDIVSIGLNTLYFNSYIDGLPAFVNYDISSQMSELASPTFSDFVVDADDGSNTLRVVVGPSSQSSLPPNAILNGLEVMEIKGEGVFVDAFPASNRKKSTAVIGGAIGGAVAFVIVLVLVLLVLRRKKRKVKTRPEDPKQKPTPTESAVWSPLPAFTSSSFSKGTERTSGSPMTNLNLGLKIPFLEIQSATGNFADDRQIGSGGFGRVYKGVLRDGTRVAVKRGMPESRQGVPEFQTEIMVLSKIRHRHLVSLIGYCEEQGEMILAYEFMEQGTLKDHLYGSGKPCLPWAQRLEICIGAARGLHYLHTGHAQGIIHRDVKSANILLDENYLAKVADFGLSKLGPLVSQTHVSTGVKGSFGYLDPEYFKTQQLTDKSDVYSFGVVLLEVVLARPAVDPSLPYEQVNLAEWGMKWQKKGMLEQIVDPSIRQDINPNSLRKFGEIAEKCLALYGVDRPSMADVLWNLEYALQLQETALRHEPFEDSVLGPTEIPMPKVQRFPSTNTKDWADDSVADASLGSSGVSTSQVFSQLITKDGR